MTIPMVNQNFPIQFLVRSHTVLSNLLILRRSKVNAHYIFMTSWYCKGRLCAIASMNQDYIIIKKNMRDGVSYCQMHGGK